MEIDIDFLPRPGKVYKEEITFFNTLNIYTYIYIYIYLFTYLYIYIYYKYVIFIIIMFLLPFIK